MVVLVIERKAMHQRNSLPSIYSNNIVLTFISIYHCIEDPYLFFFKQTPVASQQNASSVCEGKSILL